MRPRRCLPRVPRRSGGIRAQPRAVRCARSIRCARTRLRRVRDAPRCRDRPPARESVAGAALDSDRCKSGRPDRRGAARPGPGELLRGATHESNLPAYSSVAYRDLWPGIDLVLQSLRGELKYEFRVAAGANPSDIRLAWAGADGLSVLPNGSLRVRTEAGALRDQAPRSWQAGGQPVASRYVVDGRTYGFALEGYDTSRPLVIDPSLLYSTFLGGTGGDEAVGVAVDGSGNSYITGQTYSPEFPTTVGAYDTSLGGTDAYIMKLTSSGALVYSTFIGGSTPGEFLRRPRLQQGYRCRRCRKYVCPRRDHHPRLPGHSRGLRHHAAGRLSQRLRHEAERQRNGPRLLDLPRRRRQQHLRLWRNRRGRRWQCLCQLLDRRRDLPSPLAPSTRRPLRTGSSSGISRS